MIFEIEISEQADADLRGVFGYIAFELQSLQNAKGQLERLEESIMGLERLPERFRLPVGIKNPVRLTDRIFYSLVGMKGIEPL